MRNLLLILLSLAFVAGCGNTLKSSWTDFNAYYNTFYNGKEHFRDGIKQVKNQPETIDPTQPVRIHQAPTAVGGNDFQQAIDKGARILRKFPDSKWVDDAILLMGKSFYYQQEFFTALENFEELQNVAESPKMEQQAIIWKGRTQLDLKEFTEATGFLESELEQYPDEWSRNRKGEIQSLVAQHYVMLEDWDTAADYLLAAVENLNDKKLLGRTFFLQAQVLERIDRLAESFSAYGDAAEVFPNFEYLYWSRYKQGDIARKAGRYNLALDIFQSMRNDDKNLEHRGELLFEVGKTYEMMGETERAEQLYKQLLYEDQNSRQEAQELKGDLYFRLGRIYSDHTDNYQIAAAYFDSASTVRAAPSSQEEANTLADVYGDYTKLQESVSRIDSLLHLGSLSEQELDSALNRIRSQKLEEFEQRQEQDQENTLTNDPADDIDDAAELPTQYGFLNHKDRDLASQSKAQFEVVWGGRPLVDNWRTVRAIRMTAGRDNEADGEMAQNGQAAESRLDMNIEEIPRTRQQRNSLQREKLNTQYNLGNMLFLNLSMPDSARYYYHKIINNQMSEELRPRAMYSLFELFSTQDNTDSLQVWGERIVDEYPDSRYARRVKSRLKGEPVNDDSEDSTAQLRNRFQQLKEDTTTQRPAKLRMLALQNVNNDLAPKIYFSAIEEYVKQAKSADSLFTIKDTTLATARGDSLVVDDSLQSRSDYLESQLRFSGAQWDSVRFAVQQFDTIFSGSTYHEKVLKMKDLLRKGATDGESFPTCNELGISLEVDPSMDHFLSQVTYPEELEGQSISGSLKYEFVVSGSGDVKSYKRKSSPTPFDLESSLEEAFEKHLEFKEPELDNPPEKISCEVAFPIRN
ncbi:MAG: tetratricopeptide repeat protein [Bacteroidota bacterium]